MAIRGVGDISFGSGGGAGNVEHTVQAGDTFEGIAKQYGLSPEDLLAANPHIKDPGSLQPGQSLLLPAVQKALSEPTAFQGDILERGDAPSIFPGAGFDQAFAPAEARAFKFAPGEAQSLKIKLMPEQFQTNQNGRLVVSNNELIGLLRTAMNQNPGDAISLNFTRMTSGEAQISDGRSLNFSKLDPAVAQFYKEFLDHQGSGEAQLVKPEALKGLFDVLGQAQGQKAAGESMSLNFTRLDPGVASFYKEFLGRQADPGEAQLVGQETLKGIFNAIGDAQMHKDAGEAQMVKMENVAFSSGGDMPGEAQMFKDAGEARMYKEGGEAQMYKFENVAFSSGGDMPGEAQMFKDAGEAQMEALMEAQMDAGEAQMVKIENVAFSSGGDMPGEAPAQKAAPEGMMLTPDMFQVNDDGNLEVLDDQFAGFLKSALDTTTPGDLVSFGIIGARKIGQ
jgi:LysM repeat protein